jgi:hypothetical protein
VTAVELTAEEKIGVIQSHMKNVQYSKYNAQVTIIQEEALEEPNTENIAAAQEVVRKSDLQIAALQAEIDTLSA